mmetsp:Transcript_16992/g.55352  ORF Transcript_16992/g.55352 Transcript_16992/m.55352 type:complete len:383 (+) Transcript_16992:1139-2287(+)
MFGPDDCVSFGGDSLLDLVELLIQSKLLLAILQLGVEQLLLFFFRLGHELALHPVHLFVPDAHLLFNVHNLLDLALHFNLDEALHLNLSLHYSFHLYNLLHLDHLLHLHFFERSADAPHLAVEIGHAHDLTVRTDFPFRLQLSAQPRDLLLELPQHGVLWVFVDLWLVLDVLGSICVTERRDGLIEVPVGRAHVCHHHRLGVAAQRVLQQSRQLRVSVRDVLRLSIHQRRDAVPECRERQINLSRLFEPVPFGGRLGLALRSGQVHQIQLAHPDVRLALGVGLAALDRDGINRMRARRVGVHLGGADMSVAGAKVAELVALLHRLDHVRRQVLNVHPGVGVLLKLQLVDGVLGQQVAHLLVVDLQVRGTDEELGVLAAARAN